MKNLKMESDNYFILCPKQKQKKIPKTIYKSLIDIIEIMETIFMNTKNSKTSEPHKLRLNLTDKLNLKNPNKNMALANLSIYYTWKNIKSAYNNNKFKISAPTWNDELDFTKCILFNFRHSRLL